MGDCERIEAVELKETATRSRFQILCDKVPHPTLQNKHSIHRDTRTGVHIVSSPALRSHIEPPMLGRTRNIAVDPPTL